MQGIASHFGITSIENDEISIIFKLIQIIWSGFGSYVVLNQHVINIFLNKSK